MRLNIMVSVEVKFHCLEDLIKDLGKILIPGGLFRSREGYYKATDSITQSMISKYTRLRNNEESN